MDEDFTEDFEDEEPGVQEEEEETPKPAPRRQAPAPTQAPQRRPAQQPQRPQRQVVQAQAPASEPVQTQQIRFVPFEIPSRIGVFDNSTGKPLMEETPKELTEMGVLKAKQDILFGLCTEILNRISELEKNI